MASSCSAAARAERYGATQPARVRGSPHNQQQSQARRATLVAWRLELGTPACGWPSWSPRSRSPPTWVSASRWTTCCVPGGSRPRSVTTWASSRTTAARCTTSRRWRGSAASPTPPRSRPGSATTSPSAADSYEVDFAGLPMLGFMLRHVGAGSPALHRIRLGANLVVTGGKAVQRGLMSHCLTTSRMAERFELGDEVCVPLQQVFARWDGKGVPGDVGGEDIALPMRLFHLADTVEVHHRTNGLDAAVEVARARRGKHFDPAVVDVFCRVAGDVLGRPVGRARLADPHRRRAVTAAPPHRGPSSTPRSRRSPTSPTFGRHRGPATPAVSPSSPPAPRPNADSPASDVVSGSPRRAGARPRPARHPRHHPRQARAADRVGDASGCGCTRTTPSGCWPGRRRSPASAPSPRSPTSACDGSGYHRGLTGDRHPGHGAAARRRLRVPGHDRTARPPARAHRQAGGRRAARRRPRRPPRRRSRRRRARRRRPGHAASAAAAPPGSPRGRSRC